MEQIIKSIEAARAAVQRISGPFSEANVVFAAQTMQQLNAAIAACRELQARMASEEQK